MKVHEKVRKLRELKSWSQEDMAHRLQMSTNGYAKIERGQTRLNIPKLEQIVEVLGIDLAELLSINEHTQVCLVNHDRGYTNNTCNKRQESETELEKNDHGACS